MIYSTTEGLFKTVLKIYDSSLMAMSFVFINSLPKNCFLNINLTLKIYNAVYTGSHGKYIC
jgi:hypothetical protein